MKSRWSGLFIVVSATSFRVVTIRGQAGNEFKVNGQRLKNYFGGNMNEY